MICRVFYIAHGKPSLGARAGIFFKNARERFWKMRGIFLRMRGIFYGRRAVPVRNFLTGGLLWSFSHLRQISSPLEDNCRRNICRVFLDLPCALSIICRRSMFDVCLFLCLPRVTYLPGVMSEAFGKQHVWRVPVFELTANILAHGKLPFSGSALHLSPVYIHYLISIHTRKRCSLWTKQEGNNLLLDKKRLCKHIRRYVLVIVIVPNNGY
jgi:hypothetical protein